MVPVLLRAQSAYRHTPLLHLVLHSVSRIGQQSIDELHGPNDSMKKKMIK